jgi:transposase-like protein
MGTPRPEGMNRPAPLAGVKEPRERHAKFSEEFKREVIQLLDSSGQPASRIAREPKLPVSKLYQLRKERAGAV